MAIEDATFIVQRGATQFSCLGSELGDKLLDDDLLIAQRGDNRGSIVKANIQDNDLFVVTDGDNGHKSVTGAQVKALLGPPVMPWDGHDGGIFHIKNVENASLALTGGPYTAWDIDGTNEREITEVAVGEELVFVTSPSGASLFQNNRTQTWEFGDFTDVSKVTDMKYMFRNDLVFNQDIRSWDTSSVLDMTSMFYDARVFNQDISGWNTSNVTNMSSMFYNNSVFNQDIGGWDTSRVRDMKNMFQNASAFNQDISGWDTFNVASISSMFQGATAFNQDISGWDISQVTNMSSLFKSTDAFNIDIGSWNTFNVTNMTYMFEKATAFNQDISGWCVSKITSRPYNFDTGANDSWPANKKPQWKTCPRGEDAGVPWHNHNGGIFHIKNVANAPLVLNNAPFRAWDPDGTNTRQISQVEVGEELVFISSQNCRSLFQDNETQTWEFGDLTDVSKVKNMEKLFYRAREFNGDISSWDTSNVTNMAYMFSGCYSFNQPIGGWDTSNVSDMKYMFRSAYAFNQDINIWDVASVKDRLEMGHMFQSAISFNQDISGWCVIHVYPKPIDFDYDSGFKDQTAKQPQWGTCP